MIIGTTKELKNHEYRVGTTPDNVLGFVADGHTVLVETGAGEGAGFPDAQELLTIEMAGANKRANLLVVTSRVTDGLLDTLTTISSQQRNPFLYCIMPTNVTSAERKQIQARFLGLDDAGIPYRVLTAADAERRDSL